MILAILYSFPRAEAPTKPLTLNHNLSSSSQVLSVKWGAPNNIDRFDLDHYSVQVRIIIPETDEEPYYFNGTTTELSYLFDLAPFVSRGSITIHSASITAISKCRQPSPVATALLMTNIKMSTPDNTAHSSAHVSSASTNRNCEYSNTAV